MHCGSSCPNRTGNWLEVVENRELDGNGNIRILVAVRLALSDAEAEDAKPEIVGVEVYTINTGLSEEKIEVRLLGEETQETIRDTYALESKEVESEKKPEKPEGKPVGPSGSSSSEPEVSPSEPSVPGETPSEPVTPDETPSEPVTPVDPDSSIPTQPVDPEGSEPTEPEETPEETPSDPSTDGSDEAENPQKFLLKLPARVILTVSRKTPPATIPRTMILRVCWLRPSTAALSFQHW